MDCRNSCEVCGCPLYHMNERYCQDCLNDMDDDFNDPPEEFLYED